MLFFPVNHSSVLKLRDKWLCQIRSFDCAIMYAELELRDPQQWRRGEFQGLVMPWWADILRPGMTAVRRPMKQRTRVPIFSVIHPPDTHSPHYGLFHLPIVFHLPKYPTTEMENNPAESEANAHMSDATTLRIPSSLHWLAPQYKINVNASSSFSLVL